MPRNTGRDILLIGPEANPIEAFDVRRKGLPETATVCNAEDEVKGGSGRSEQGIGYRE